MIELKNTKTLNIQYFEIS